jgi:sporulation protein YlmC with PRC-barrel domain
MRLELGKRVSCSDGEYGELADVVIDPAERRVTHLIVKAAGAEPTRLVPVDLVAAGEGGSAGIALTCTAAELGELPTPQAHAFLELGQSIVEDPDWELGIETVLTMPYEPGSLFGDYGATYGTPATILYDRVPKGEVEIRKASAVYAADGDFLGTVEGFVVDGDDDRVTHFVLERGHLWGRRDITIPIAAAERIETDSVTLNVSKHAVADLPSIAVRRWH